MYQQTSATTCKAHDLYYSIKINARDKRRHKLFFGIDHYISIADIAECDDKTLAPHHNSYYAHNCHADANCTNTKGSFFCMCRTGYSGDGVTCTGIFGSGAGTCIP